MIFRLQLFKHPNTPEQGGSPVDSLEIAAPTVAIAIDLAHGSIESAPSSALSHPEDQFVLVDDAGTIVNSWNSTSA
jgi:hypothetical protein